MSVRDQWRAWLYDWTPNPRAWWAERGVTWTDKEWRRVARRRRWLKVKALRHLVCCGGCD